MVKFYLGDPQTKRKIFRRRRKRAASVDNCDVTASIPYGNRTCLMLGEIPYGNMRVGEYIGYARALTDGKLSDEEAKKLLRRTGMKISPRRKMCTLSRLEYRAVLLAAALRSDTQSLWLNLDGIIYTPLTALRMRRWANRLGKIYGEVNIAVSDFRFAAAGEAIRRVTVNRYATHKSKYLGRLRFSRDLRGRSFTLLSLYGNRAVVCG